MYLRSSSQRVRVPKSTAGLKIPTSTPSFLLETIALRHDNLFHDKIFILTGFYFAL